MSMVENSIKTKGAVQIDNCGIYVKDEQALEPLFEELKEQGYEVQKSCDSDRREAVGCPKAWYVKLREDVLESKARCLHCNNIIDSYGVRSHNNKCSACGETTYLKYVKGGTIRFYFADDESHVSRMNNDILLEIFDYLEDSQELRLVAKPLQAKGAFAPTLLQSRDILDANESQYRKERVTTDDGNVDLIVIKHIPNGQVQVINTMDLTGEVVNFENVRLFRGKEYDPLFDTLPVLESHMIYQAWNWAPVKANDPQLAVKIMDGARQVSSDDYYSSGHIFGERVIGRMRIFVEHLTEVPVEEWDNFVLRVSKSAPTFIKELRKFCSKMAQEAA